MAFLILLALSTCVLAFYIRHHYSYWQRRGFPVVAGTNIPFGCLDSVVKRERSLGMALYDVYRKSSDRFVGIYLLFRPAILVRDAELIRKIMVQDFPSFHDRGLYCDEKNDPYSANLFSLKGERWRKLRAKIAPSFSSGKLKGMFETIEDVGNKMIQHLDNQITEKGGEATVEIKEVITTYGVDIIGSVIFGLDVDSFKNPDSKYRTISDQFSTPNFQSIARAVFVFTCPVFESMYVRFGLKDKITEYMTQMVRQTVEFREKNNFSRKDLMQLLIQLRNTGSVNSDDKLWDFENSTDKSKSMTIESIAGHSFTFYVAGFETSSSAVSFTMFELAQNPQLYAKAHQDIDKALERHEGKITYESLQDMKFIDLCLMETLRKYPALPILNRECTKDYHIPGSDKIIKKGTPLVISLFGIHRDPQYFPDPMKYDPERFLESNQKFNPAAYMPFGGGPRHCIAQRLGQLNAKIAIVKILNSYDFDVLKKGEIEIDNFSLPIVPKGGVNLKFRKKNRK